MVSTIAPGSLNYLADLIATDLRTSTSTRQSLGGGGAAFGWAGELPPTLASYVNAATTTGMTVPITLVSESITPAAVVAESQPKPKATAITPTQLVLKKFAGYGECTLEVQLDAVGIYPAIVSVLGSSALKAFEVDAMAVLDAGSGATGSGATWLAAIYAGQGAVLANGGRPSVLVASAADYGEIMAEIAGGAGYALDPASPTGTFAGSVIHFSSGLAAGKAFVLDRAAVTCAEHESNPVVSVDTSGVNNVARVVADVIAGTIVTSPAHVCEVTKTP